VSQKFGGVIHFGSASHGDFTASLDALCVFLYLALFERSNRYFEKFMAVAAIAALLYLIMQMGSRNGLLCFGFVTVFGVFLVMRNRSWTFQFIIVAGAFIVGVTALYFFQDSPTIQRAIYEMTVESGGERVDYWHAGGIAVKDAPVLGQGGDETASLYSVGKWSPNVEDHVMHNTFLEVAVEYGLLGLTFYLIFVYTIIRWGYKQVMYAIKTNDLILGTPAIAYTVSIMAGMFISRVWDTTLWYYLGIVFAIGILWIEPLNVKIKHFVRGKPKLSSQLVTA
jgi:O-antigen ligase